MYKKYARKPIAKRGKRSNRSRKSSQTRKRNAVPAATRRFVKKMIHSNIENKQVQDNYPNLPLQVATSGQVPFILSMTPDGISQGTASNNRIGDEITPRYSYIKGQVNALPYDSLTNPGNVPIAVQFILFKLKSGPYTMNSALTNTSGTFGVDTSKFFNSNNTTSAFTNSPLDLELPVNTDMFQVIRRYYRKLKPAFNSASTSYISPYFSEAPFSIKFYFRIDTHLKKHLKYNDNASGVTNDNLFLAICPVQLDGGSSLVRPAELHYVRVYNFEDA